MAYADTWSVRVLAENDEFYRASAAVGGAGALTLLKSSAAINGAGYKLLFTSAGDSSGMTYTIVGEIVGQTSGTTTEVLAGPNATTSATTNYWASIISITASAAATGAQKIGFTGSLALPRCRIRGVYLCNTSSAGLFSVNMNSATGTEILGIDLAAAAPAVPLYIRTNHILVGRSAAQSDFGVVTAPATVLVTLFLT